MGVAVAGAIISLRASQDTSINRLLYYVGSSLSNHGLILHFAMFCCFVNMNVLVYVCMYFLCEFKTRPLLTVQRLDLLVAEYVTKPVLVNFARRTAI